MIENVETQYYSVKIDCSSQMHLYLTNILVVKTTKNLVISTIFWLS